MAKTIITVNNNGSLRLEGEFEIMDKNGNAYDLGGREIVSSWSGHLPRSLS